MMKRLMPSSKGDPGILSASPAENSGLGRSSAATRPPDAEHVSLVAEVRGEVVGVATYERGDEPGEAEVAFIVDDEFQGRGVGMLLLEHLAVVASRHGVVRFVADTLPANVTVGPA